MKALFLLASVGDVVTTLFALGVGGYEANPVMAAVITHGGTTGFAVGNLVLSALAAWYFGSRVWRLGLLLLVAARFAAVLNNAVVCVVG